MRCRVRYLGPVVAMLIAGCGDREVWSAEVLSLKLSHGGGGPGPQYTPTAECPFELFTYTLTVSPTTLDASICLAQDDEGDQTLPIAHKAATVALSAAEFDALVPTLEMMRVVDDGECGADKATDHLTVKTATTVSEYTDSFYSGCQHHDDLPAVNWEALDEVESAFRQLAFPAP